ncbi:MAG: acyltransferase [Pseudomonadota bacterium]
MNKHFSLYLDLMRFSAAVLVLVLHYIQNGIVNAHMAAFLPELGREAVMVFFVLSGFVIAYSTEVNRQSVKQYAVARAARIYSVALPLLLAAFLIVFVVKSITPEALPDVYQLDRAYLYLPFHLLFMGELWQLAELPPWLEQYWSLSYEVWYYILFAAVYYSSGVRRIFFGGIVFLIIGYKLWLLLPVWLSGVCLYHWQKKFEMPVVLARFGWLLTVGVLIVYKVFDLDILLRAAGTEIWPFESLKLGSADRYLADYVICVLVCCNFMFALHAKFAVLQNAGGTIRALSSHTFTLYLVHWLVIALWLQVYPHDASSVLDITALTVTIVLVTYATGFITERQSAFFKTLFEKLYDAVASSLSRMTLMLKDLMKRVRPS